MTSLREHAWEKYGHGHSQFEEAAIIDCVLDRIGAKAECTVEFGAGEGPELSNTWHLAENGATALFIEADDQRFNLLENEASDLPDASCYRALVTDIDPYLEELEVDVMSIDVDGEDYAIFERMQHQPKVLVIEHHPMIPAHVSYVGGPDVGASALALTELAESKGYSLVGTTHCNCVFVRFEDFWAFDDLDTDLVSIFQPSAVTFAVSNVKTGDYTMVGPWPFGRGEDLTCE